MNDLKLSALKLYIVPLLVVVSVLLLIPLVFLPQVQRIRDKNLEVQSAGRRLKVLNTKIEDLNQIDEVVETEKLVEMEKVIPSDKQLASLVVGVRGLASGSNLSVTGMELSPGRVSTQSATLSASKRTKSELSQKEGTGLTFSLSLKGKKLQNFLKFFSNIEKAKRLLGIESVQLSKEDKDMYKFDFEVAAPFREIKSSGDAIASPLPEFTSQHQSIYDFVITFINYTNVAVQKVKTGITDPFK